MSELNSVPHVQKAQTMTDSNAEYQAMLDEEAREQERLQAEQDMAIEATKEEAMTDRENRDLRPPCPFCGTKPLILDDIRAICNTRGCVFFDCSISLRFDWNSAYCWKEIDRLQKELAEVRQWAAKSIENADECGRSLARVAHEERDEARKELAVLREKLKLAEEALEKIAQTHGVDGNCGDPKCNCGLPDWDIAKEALAATSGRDV